MKYFSMLIKPASSTCNLRCKYCFYCDVSEHRDIKNYGVMSREVMEKLIDQVLSSFSEEVTINFAFQGGEPTCAGIEYFRVFTDYVERRKKNFHHIRYAIQTNGSLLNDEWISLFKKSEFLVGISLDGEKGLHDELRPNNRGQGTHESIMSNIKKMLEAEVDFNILTVLSRQLAQKPKELFEFYRSHNFDYVQLIPCLPDFESKEDNYSLRPQDFYDFYDVFFEEWHAAYQNNRILSVGYFDNMIPLFANHPPRMCGYLGFCSMQFVVESDGSVYPCDFYVLDEYKIGNIQEMSLEEIAKSAAVEMFIKEPKRMSKLCADCRYQKICNGNCKRMNICYFDDEFCALQAFMKKHEEKILAIARRI